MDFPDTPEAIAFLLLMLILRTDPADARRPEHEVLTLYAECLASVNGDREDITRH